MTKSTQQINTVWWNPEHLAEGRQFCECLRISKLNDKYIQHEMSTATAQMNLMKCHHLGERGRKRCMYLEIDTLEKWAS